MNHINFKVEIKIPPSAYIRDKVCGEVPFMPLHGSKTTIYTGIWTHDNFVGCNYENRSVYVNTL